MLEIILTNNRTEVETLVAKGYCPVECSIGGESIVDDLAMDHHGELSDLESVAIRAYRDHYGARAADPRFVGVGVADADMAFAIASLAGLIPHPDREVPDHLPPFIQAGLKRDWSDLAQTIATVDTNPIGLSVPEMPHGAILMTWAAMTQNARDSLGGTVSVGLWRSLLEGNPNQLKTFFDAAKTSELSRIEGAKGDLDTVATDLGGVLTLRGPKAWGFDVWYGRQIDHPPTDPLGWKSPVVLVWLEKAGNLTIGCPNTEVAEALFGPGGLKNVFAAPGFEGWGGREAIGGSPRGEVMDPDSLGDWAQAISCQFV